MRLDKYLKVSRLIKRRTVANEACDAGRVTVNGRQAKASLEVKTGDIIEIKFGDKITKLEVLEVKETVRKDDAGGMYKLVPFEITSDPFYSESNMVRLKESIANLNAGKGRINA